MLVCQRVNHMKSHKFTNTDIWLRHCYLEYAKNNGGITITLCESTIGIDVDSDNYVYIYIYYIYIYIMLCICLCSMRMNPYLSQLFQNDSYSRWEQQYVKYTNEYTFSHDVLFPSSMFAAATSQTWIQYTTSPQTHHV